ncbi:phospholipase A2 inhibitor and Ly6/PLAUR domain-containing protein isoform X2 [Heterocephalus glaber]|uniref:Phospholipase A2 inhibitor and Ly6/PLAUR domain-containing protein isoform X2 n=1 Tax=Heterocephalus glaber TaxID=10181 RepID=A0AAX6SDF3_HETGA|nr:phospholipase A2 inhibitor and Ly6/PLAUR domain-containing protein isoform X2 [Heterocephalus glaber]
MELSTRQDTFLLLAFTLLCTLVGLGCSLTCEVCNGPEKTCSGKMRQCEDGKDTCVIIVSESHEKGPYVSTVKTCMKSRDCHSGYVSTTMGPNNYMVTNTHCCQRDGCNSGSVPRIISAKFATRGCATKSACHAKPGAEVPSASYYYFLNRADCHEASLPYGRAE